MAARLQVRRGKASRWKELNPVLAWGEIAHEIDTNFLKIGDGVSDWNSLPYFEGKQGLQGIQGEKGEKGDQGDIGPRGLQGLQGIQGIKGERGQKGDTGEKGEKGDRGPQGLKGEKGDKGQKGDGGDRGEKGDKGERGLPGPQGIKGETGEQGPIGPIGPQGEQGSDGIGSVSYPLKYEDKHLSVEQSFFTELVNNASKGFSAQGSGGGNLAIRWNDEKVVSAARTLNFTGTAISDVIVDGKDVTITINDTGGGGGGSGTVTSITAGTGLSGGTITTSGTIAVNFGSTSTTACVGDDARLSDARTPTAHTHVISDVTNLQISLDNKVDDSQISAFGLTLIDDADAATARTTLGLGTIATQNANNIAVTGGTLQGVTVTTGTYSSLVNQGLLYAVRKSTAGTITKGRPVYIVGSTGNHLTVELAQADTEATSAYAIGVAATDITNGADGFIMLKGRLTGLNNLPTSTFVDGDPIYLDETTAGGFRTTPPTAPNHGVLIGFVVRANNGSAGEMDVHVQNYQELEELSDVNISGIAADHFLKRNTANTRWENVSPANARIGLGLSTAITDVVLTTNNQLRFIYANNTTESFSFGSLAFQSGTFSGTSSGTNTGDQNVFTTIAVAGQSNVVADSASDILTLIAGSGISLTTNATNDSVTITNTGGGGGGVTEEFVIAMAIAL